MKLIQIRNVPEDLHRSLKSRAAMQGKSLSDYALGELRRAMERPTMDEMLARLATRPPVSVSESAAKAVRRERDVRG